MNEQDWCKLASNILKAELTRKNISYLQLVDLLNKNGLNETHDSILSKMKRGSFKFAFFLQCAAAIGLKTLYLDELDYINANEKRKTN